MKNPSLLAIAEHAGCTPAQAVFKIAQIHGVTPLSGTTKERHMRDDAAVERVELDMQPEGGDIEVHLKTIEDLIWA